MAEAAQDISYMTDPVKPYPSAHTATASALAPPSLSWDPTTTRILWHDDRGRRELHPVLPRKGTEERSLEPPVAVVPPRVRSRERELWRLSFGRTRLRGMGNRESVGWSIEREKPVERSLDEKRPTEWREVEYGTYSFFLSSRDVRHSGMSNFRFTQGNWLYLCLVWLILNWYCCVLKFGNT
jgi:hypothetical protein